MKILLTGATGQVGREVQRRSKLLGLTVIPTSRETLDIGDKAQTTSIFEHEDFDLIILDPPAFAKSLKARHNAIQAYKRLNAEALRKIKPGGILFTFSCSQVVDRRLFANTITAAGLESKRNVRILHQLSQPADHPINIFHPETEYLKGLVLFVE